MDRKASWIWLNNVSYPDLQVGEFTYFSKDRKAEYCIKLSDDRVVPVTGRYIVNTNVCSGVRQNERNRSP